MKGSYRNITIGVLTDRDLLDRHWAGAFLEVLNAFDSFKPDLYGNFEPVDIKFSGTEAALVSWKDPFLWKNTNSGFEGSLWCGRGNQHSAIYLSRSLRDFQPDAGIRFLTDCARSLQVDFGYIHLTTETELRGGLVPYETAHVMDVGVSSHDLRKGIPNLGWCTLFGAPYSALICTEPQISGMEMFRIGASQTICYFARPLHYIIEDFESFNLAREKAKAQIGPRLFWQDSRTAEHIPTFSFGPSRRP